MYFNVLPPQGPTTASMVPRPSLPIGSFLKGNFVSSFPRSIYLPAAPPTLFITLLSWKPTCKSGSLIACKLLQDRTLTNIVVEGKWLRHENDWQAASGSPLPVPCAGYLCPSDSPSELCVDEVGLPAVMSSTQQSGQLQTWHAFRYIYPKLVCCDFC